MSHGSTLLARSAAPSRAARMDRARAGGKPRSGLQTSPSCREAACREQAQRDILPLCERCNRRTCPGHPGQLRSGTAAACRRALPANGPLSGRCRAVSSPSTPILILAVYHRKGKKSRPGRNLQIVHREVTIWPYFHRIIKPGSEENQAHLPKSYFLSLSLHTHLCKPTHTQKTPVIWPGFSGAWAAGGPCNLPGIGL